MSKKIINKTGIVYSTDPGFKIADEYIEKHTLSPEHQLLTVMLDRKQRAGKSVTLVTGFEGTIDSLEDLGKRLKSFCGTGGSVKNGEIIIQGDNVDRIIKWLLNSSYLKSKKR